MKSKLILASASPRRRELLHAAGLDFEIMPSDANEIKSGLAPEELAMKNAAAKAEDIFGKTEGAYVLGADTIVVIDGMVLGKPRDREDALSMLSILNGRTHTVITGWCVIRPDGKKEVRRDISRVTFMKNSSGALLDYIDTVEPMDKAGSYAIQGLGRNIVAGYSGDLNNIIGLPSSAINRVKELTE